MAVNDQYGPASKFFSAVPAGTGAPGSPGASEAGAMPDDAFHPQLTMPYQSVQNAPVPTGNVGLDDSALPGQTTEGLSGQDITTTGAGLGRGQHFDHPAAGGRS